MKRSLQVICVLLIGATAACGKGEQAREAEIPVELPASTKSKEQLRADAEKLAALTKPELETLLRHCDTQAVRAAADMSYKEDLLGCTLMNSSMSDNDLYNAKQAGASPSDRDLRMSWFVMNQQSVRDRLRQGIPMDETLLAQYSFLCGKRDWSGDPGGGRTYTTWTCKVTADDLASAGIGKPGQ